MEQKQSKQKKCLILINEISGKSKNIDTEKLVNIYSAKYDVSVLRIQEENYQWNADGVDLLVVCGGDGTFNRALNVSADLDIEIIYYSFGTFNESAKAKRNKKDAASDMVEIKEYALANDILFTYVFAAGIFTPLGYIVKPSTKKKIGIFAYLLRVVDQYKVYNIPAKITADGEVYEGDYTLLMAIDSNRCFGFNFNRIHKDDNGKLELLLIKSPGKNNFINKIKIFFPLFRAFFMGFKCEYKSKNMLFKTTENLNIELKQKEMFNVDGEAMELEGVVDIKVTLANRKIYIANANDIKK